MVLDERLAGRGVVAGIAVAANAEFWIDAQEVTWPLAVPTSWTVAEDPLRLLDATGAVMLRAGDQVSFPIPSVDEPSVAALDLTIERVCRRRTVDVRIPAVSSDGRGEGLVADLRRSLRVWRIAPLLPLTGLVLALATLVPDGFSPRPSGCGVGTGPPCRSGSQAAYLTVSVALLPVLVYWLGFLGAERRWYAEVFTGHKPHATWMWSSAGQYVGRFSRLGLILLIVYVPLLLGGAMTGKHDKAGQTVAFAAVTIAVDVLLTFVPPALTFSSASAWTALGEGLRLLRSSWPANLPYVLVPPLAAALMLRLGPGHPFGTVAAVAGGTAAQLLTMLFAGATTMFYLRHHTPRPPATPGVESVATQAV